MSQELAAINYWESRFKTQQTQIDALLELVKEQDKKILELAFELGYARRSLEVINNG